MRLTYKPRMLVAIGAVTLVAGGSAAYASASTTGVTAAGATVLVTKLDGPFGLALTSNTRALVALNASGQVSRVDLKTGDKHALISGLSSPSGVATAGDKMYVALGGPDEMGTPAPGPWPAASVLRANADGSHVRVLADLMKYELKHNPDGQVQFVKGKPVDALSNPFGITSTKWGLLVADGGANDVLRIDPVTGKVSTYFVPPTVKTAACLMPQAQANPGTKGCDPVPTGVVQQGNSVYVSTLGAESPGAARIYQLDGPTGHVQRMWKGFTALTGVAVSPKGAIYASEVLYGAPQGDGPPPADFDPSSVGRITRIMNGKVTHASVPMPTGLVYRNGQLYATAWSIAHFFGMQHAGQVVQVKAKAFS